MIEGCEYGEYCEKKEVTNRVIGAVFLAERVLREERGRESSDWRCVYGG